MNLTTNRIFFSILGMLLMAVAFEASAQQPETPFDRLIDKFIRGQVFHSEFSHEYVDSYTGDTVATSGTIWVGEQMYKVQNENQTVVVDGELSRVYDRRRNRVIISTYEPEDDDFAPSRFLNGSDTTYTVKNQQRRGEGTLITLASEDPFSIFRRVEISVSEELLPLKIFALDQAENRITTYFSSGRFIVPEEGLFQLEYPDEAEVIDMRN